MFVIPTACKHKAEAWSFLEWMTRRQPVEKFTGTIGNVPPLRAVGEAPRFQNDPLFKFAVGLSQSPNGFGPPGLAMWPTYAAEIGRAEEAAMVGRQDPQAVLDDLQRRMEAEYRESKEDLGR